MSWFKRDPDPVSAEIQDYLERETARNIEAGMSPEEAAFAARRKLGPVARVTEETREAAAGGVLTWIEMLWRDLRHGVRMFAKNPAFTLTCVVSLAFGTGANVAMFSGADAMLLRPLPVPRPGEIVRVGSAFTLGDFSFIRTSYLNYLDILQQSHSFNGLTAIATVTYGIAAEEHSTAQVKSGAAVTANFFDVMGVHPVLGRGFRPEEDQVRGRDAVIVLSYATWQGMGADPKILGRVARVGGIDFTVVGVMPESFSGPDRDAKPAFYIPTMMWPVITGDPGTLDDRAYWAMDVKGRLRQAITERQAQAELDTIAANLERAHRDTNRNQRLTIATELEMNIRQNRVYTALVAILTLLSMAVLIVACANVAGLLTSRAPLRSREIALRLAIGAGRARLIRQLLTESSLMALAGGVLGLPLAYISIQLLRQIQFPNDLAFVPRLELDQRALLFSMVIAMGSVILFGLIPAIQTTRTNLATAFKSGSSAEPGRRRFWGRNLLLAVQVAFSLVLLTLSVFTYRAFAGELSDAVLFRRDHIAMMTLRPRGLRYTDDQAKQFYQMLLDRVRALPGVTSAALSTAKPAGGMDPIAIAPEGFHFPPGQTSVIAAGSRISESYFETLGIRILRGRGIAATDTSSSPLVTVVNETLAEHYWPNQDPIGRRILVDGRWTEIVGIARNSRYLFPTAPPTDFLYVPYRQVPLLDLTLFAGTAGDSAGMIEPLRKLVADINANMPVYNIQTMEYYYSARVTIIGHVITEIIGAMGLMGLTLAMIGLYALMSYSVSRRTREIGVRMAVGADRTNVMTMIVRQGLIPVLAGIAIGLLLSAGAAQLLRTSFPLGYDIGPATYGTVAPLLLFIALAAAYFPARRAALVDPMTALRDE